MTAKTTERGPYYNVELIDSLPLGKGPMRQQLPSRQDLLRVRNHSERMVAGYEVLLNHYLTLVRMLKRVNGLSCEVQTHVGTGDPHFLFPVPCDVWAELQGLINAAE